MSTRALITAPYMLAERERVEPLLDVPGLEVSWAQVTERLEEDELLKRIGGVDGILCGDDRITRRVLEHADRLKVIVKWGTGIDSIDTDSAREMGIAVLRTKDAFTNPVADTTLGMILAFCRSIPKNDALMKSGDWCKPPGFALCERSVGIIGLGTIGSAVARRLAAFGARVLASDTAAIPAQTSQGLGVEMVTLERLLQESDFVSLHCDLNPTSRHILNAERLALLKPSAFVINTARGPLIDEHALAAALQNGRLSGAGLDVFEHEPLAQQSPLRHMDQVLLSAHNSNSSPSSWLRVHRRSVKLLLEALELA